MVTCLTDCSSEAYGAACHAWQCFLWRPALPSPASCGRPSGPPRVPGRWEPRWPTARPGRTRPCMCSAARAQNALNIGKTLAGVATNIAAVTHLVSSGAAIPCPNSQPEQSSANSFELGTAQCGTRGPWGPCRASASRPTMHDPALIDMLGRRNTGPGNLQSGRRPFSALNPASSPCRRGI